MKITYIPKFFGGRVISRGSFCILLLLLFSQESYVAAQHASARSVATNETGTPRSETYYPQNPLWVDDDGNVFFGNSGVSLSYWEAAGGTKTRLLQPNDPMPGYQGSILRTVAAPNQGTCPGRLAVVTTWAAKGAKNPAGVFVYDGSQYQKIAVTGETAPGTGGGVFSGFRDIRKNANDQVAFVAQFDPVGPNMLGVFLGSPTGAPVKIATVEDLDPLVNGPDNIYLIGVDNAGNVAFLTEDYANPAGYALVVGSPTGVLSVIQSGAPAPGTAGNLFLVSSSANYWMNSSGSVAFFAQVQNVPGVWAGIWVRSLAGAVQKVAAIGDSTDTTLGGTYNSFTFRGFNNNGQVLYSSNLVGSATTNQALFHKTVADSPEVVFYRNQTYSGSQQIDTIASTYLGQSGKVAVLATLKNPYGRVLLLSDPGTNFDTVVTEGDATPASGSFAQIQPVFWMNPSDQVVFRSDITSLNGSGLFWWTSGSPIRSIVNTGETIPANANTALTEYVPAASDDEAIVWGRNGEGQSTLFTKSLRPGDNAVRRIIGDGDAAPGGGKIMFLGRPAINDKEEVAVFSSIIGGTPYPGDALWLSKPGNSLQRLVGTGDSAPGAAGGFLNSFPTVPRINNQSEVAFYAAITGSTSNSSPNGIFLISSSGTIQSVVRIGDASPVGGTFSGIYSIIYLSDLGTVAFRATSQISSSQYIDGYFVGSADESPVKLMAVGDSWGEGAFTGIKYNFKMNSAGQVVFWADLSNSDGGIFVATPGSAPVAIALADDDSMNPGDLIELEYADAFFDINSSGQVGFWGVYWVDPQTQTYGTGYFTGAAGTSPVLKLSSGQALPGGGTAPGFVPGSSVLALADSGELAMYVPGVVGAPDLPRYIIAGVDGTLRRFASVGDHAPGTDSEFGRFAYISANTSNRFFINATLVEGSATQGIFQSATVLAPDDIDADGVSDIAVYRPAGGIWFSLPSLAPGTYRATPWGAAGDVTIVGDYDGDGKGDLAVWRPGSGVWYILPSGSPGTYRAFQWGNSTDIAVPGDYDGDGTTDPAVWRPSNGVWYLLPSSAPGTYIALQWGATGFTAVPGDYDADGRTDMAVWRSSTGAWYILPSASPGTYYSVQWGATADKPVPADYDGDGKTDVAVWRPSTGYWYVLPSGTPGSYSGTGWGAAADVPVSGDYDGDGKMDIGVWRPSTGVWYILPSNSPGTYRGVLWGLESDVPVSGLTDLLYTPAP
jgi:hypothetical protein